MNQSAKTHRLMPDSVFANAYRVVGAIGEGSMGTVYEARRLADDVVCALKVMKPSIAAGEKSAERFGREARVGERIDSKNVVEVFDAGFDEATGLHWLVMEYLRGRHLGDHLETHSLDRAGQFELLEQLFDAMAAAHSAGVVHRDLKPENVFVMEGDDGIELKVLDFGVAKTMRAGMVVSATEGGLGTPLWTAPEQGKGGKHIRPAVDVWALGLLTFFVISGKMYWFHANQKSSSMLDLAKEMLRDAIEPPSERASQIGVEGVVPSGLDAWFERCVCREQEKRFQDAGEAWQALEPILKGKSKRLALSASGPLARGGLLALIALVAVAIVAAWMLSR